MAVLWLDCCGMDWGSSPKKGDGERLKRSPFVCLGSGQSVFFVF